MMEFLTISLSLTTFLIFFLQRSRLITIKWF